MRAGEFTNSKLVIFDIDDTLVNTDTRVGVVKDGKTIKQLNSHDFTHYKLEPGEEFDFGAFRDARDFFANARPIAPMIRQLKQDIATGNRVIMVTARADFNDRDIFLDTFRKWGIDMSKVHVYRAGNIQMKVATEEKKKIILRHLLGKTHYDKVIMYDDAVPNLDAFLSLAQDYPWSKFYAWHVDRQGGATEYHRSGAGVNEDSKSNAVRAYHGNQGGIDTEQLHAPMWFTASRADAEHYAGDDGYVVVVDLDIKNPYRLRAGEEANTVLRGWQDLQAQGYDGIYDRRLGDWIPFAREQIRVISKDDTFVGENFADGRVKGKSRPGRVKRSGASCKGSVTDLRAKARKYGGERGKMYHWCANMKSGKSRKK